jgi:hypothetical protein
MKKDDLQSRSIEQLWTLHEEIASILAAKMEAEKFRLEKRLEQLKGKTSDKGLDGVPIRRFIPVFKIPTPSSGMVWPRQAAEVDTRMAR